MSKDIFSYPGKAFYTDDMSEINSSTDLYPQEYPCFGSTDLRTPAFHATYEDGSTVTRLRYKSHSIIKGKPSLEIYTADNIVDLVKTEVVNGTLKIGFKKGYSISYNKLIIRVSSEDINAISLAGSGSIDLANGVKTNKMNISLAGSGDVMGKNIFCQEDLRIALSGSGDVTMQQLACNQFDVSLAGSGDVLMKDVNVHTAKVSLAGSGCVEMYGKTDKSHFELAGSGEILAAGFEAKEVNISIAGSGDVECHATDHLKVSISGSGEVGYKGNPQLELPKRGVHKL